MSIRDWATLASFISLSVALGAGVSGNPAFFPALIIGLVLLPVVYGGAKS